MGQTPSEPRRGVAARRSLIFAGLGLLVLVLAVGVWRYRFLFLGAGGELADALGTKMQRSRLEIMLQAAADETPPVASRRGFLAAEDTAGLVAASKVWETCPTLTFRFGASAPETAAATKPRDPEEEAKDPCPTLMIYQTAVQIPALTLQARRGGDVFQWLTENPAAQALFQSELGRGVFMGLLEMLKVRGEDLRIADLTGSVLEPVFESALAADGRLDVIPSHGPAGSVFSFVKKDAVLAHRALLLLINSLSGVAYEVRQLQQPVVEMRFGTRTFILADDGTRLYLATGLAGLVDALEDAPVPVPEEASGSLTLTVRAEAFLKSLQASLAGGPTWRFHFGFDLSKSTSAPAGALLESGRLFQAIGGKIPSVVLQATPFDTFAGLAMGLSLPKDLAKADWGAAATGSLPDLREGGVGLLWELDGKIDQLTSIGLIVSSPPSKEGADLEAVQAAWHDPGLVQICPGAVLAATAATLLTRMRESCERRNPSVLDWQDRQGDDRALPDQEVALFLNPAVGGRELYVAGGGTNTDAVTSGYGASADPAAAAAKATAMQELAGRTQATLDTIPVLGYAGQRQPSGNLALKGFTAHAPGQGATTKRN